ncbi:GGDEF domain-containing protein [Frankia sp. CNm7]|nr:GGDEF domain-containing protein [Frankia nepalensis]MBL7518545.1 GGDEF domain-containing protein [Frankia nepalensis]
MLTLVLALLALSTASQLALSGQPRLVAQAATMFATGALATVFAVVGIARTRGVERRWRLLVAAGPLSTLPGAVEWTRQYFSGNPELLRLTPPESVFLVAPVLAIAGLICMPAGTDERQKRAPPRPDGGVWPRYSHTVIALDGLMIVLSIFLIAWFALLRHVVGSGISGTSFVIALAFAMTSALLVVVLALVATFRRPSNGRALALLGVGLVALAASETVLVRLSLPGADVQGTVPLWIGAAAGPVLVALAMIAPARDTRHQRPPERDRVTIGRFRWQGDEVRRWLHAYLPYLPLAVAAVLVLATAVRDGALRGLTLYVALCLTALATLRQLIVVAENRRLVSDLRVVHQQLRHQAYHDGLTGLANRALFILELELAVTAHSERGQPVVVLFCDIDHFKTVNDTHGHAAGDQFLRTVADRLRTAVREDDLAARLGGDEFAVLLTRSDADPHTAGRQCARRITAAMDRPVTLAGHLQRIQISIGVALADSHQSLVSAEQILHQADTAMYHVKQLQKG